MRMRYVCSAPASFCEPCWNGSLASSPIAATIRGTSCGGRLRKSFLVELRHSISKEAIALQFAEKLRVRDGGFVAALGDDGQILQVLDQLFIVGNREHHRRFFP